MKTKEDLIQQLDESRAKIRAIIDSVDTQRELYPGWTSKHFLAHLTGWDDATATSIRAHAIGRMPGAPAYLGIDYYNAESVATRVDLTYQHVVMECELARAQLKATLMALPPEKFDEEMLYPWGRTGSVAGLVEIMIDHEHEHADEIRRIIEAEKAQQPVNEPESQKVGPEKPAAPPLNDPKSQTSESDKRVEPPA
jgi:hypothetical protein